MLAGLAVIVTGLFMMKRVQTGIFTRNPYLFSDMTWGLMYVLHGLAGVGLIALMMVHVYMGIRPEKLPITKSMIFGWMSRDFYLEEHDPERWAVKKPRRCNETGLCRKRWRLKLRQQCETIEECYEFTLSYAARGVCRRRGSEPGRQLRDHLTARRGGDARAGSGDAGRRWSASSLTPRKSTRHFSPCWSATRRARLRRSSWCWRSRRSVRSSIDNLNASIHLRALLADLFLVTEILAVRQARPAAATDGAGGAR